MYMIQATSTPVVTVYCSFPEINPAVRAKTDNLSSVFGKHHKYHVHYGTDRSVQPSDMSQILFPEHAVTHKMHKSRRRKFISLCITT